MSTEQKTGVAQQVGRAPCGHAKEMRENQIGNTHRDVGRVEIVIAQIELARESLGQFGCGLGGYRSEARGKLLEAVMYLERYAKEQLDQLE